MDIAKIRKKARKEKAPEEKQQEGEVSVQADAGVLNEEVQAKETVEPERGAEDAAASHTVPEEPSSAQDDSSDGTSDTETGEQVELLTFSLGGEEFAFKVDEIEEILRLQRLTIVPTLPGYVVGITSLRGKIIPVIDLKARLNLEEAGREQTPEGEGGQGSRDSKILIIAGPKGIIGAMIDRVIGVVSVAKEDVLEPPAHLSEAEMKYIEGVVILDKRFISVLRSHDAMNIEI